MNYLFSKKGPTNDDGHTRTHKKRKRETNRKSEHSEAEGKQRNLHMNDTNTQAQN